MTNQPKKVGRVKEFGGTGKKREGGVFLFKYGNAKKIPRKQSVNIREITLQKSENFQKHKCLSL